MQIEQLASMPAELPPPTTTTIGDAAAAAPKIYSFKTFVMAKWRSKGALILYASLGLMLLGCKMFWPEPQKADASATNVATAIATAATKPSAPCREDAGDAQGQVDEGGRGERRRR